MPLIPGRVTVGIPTYNRADFAERAARSVLAQTYPDLELVVSDDPFPSDDSARRIETLNPNGKIVRVVRQPQRLGLQANFDACLRLATGEYFLLLGDDDQLHADVIAELVRGFTHPPAAATPSDIGLVWCPCNIVNSDGRLLWTTPPGPPLEVPERFLVALWRGNRGARLSSILLRTDDAIQVGGFKQCFGDLCDIGLWGQAAVSHRCICCVPRPLVDYTNHPESATSISSPEIWRRHANEVLNALLQRSQSCGFSDTNKTIKRHKADFLAGITLTVLVQYAQKPGWLRLWAAEFWRSSRLTLTPFVFKRAFKDGWKLLRLHGKK